MANRNRSVLHSLSERLQCNVSVQCYQSYNQQIEPVILASFSTVRFPLPIHGIAQDTFLKILGVTITNTLSASTHIRETITHCAQTLHALRVLRCYGLPGGGGPRVPVP